MKAALTTNKIEDTLTFDLSRDDRKSNLKRTLAPQFIEILKHLSDDGARGHVTIRARREARQGIVCCELYHFAAKDQGRKKTDVTTVFGTPSSTN